MTAAFAYLGMLLISLVIALLAVLQLGDFFFANHEFIYVIGTVGAYVAAAMAVFVLGYAAARHIIVLDAVALLLAAGAFALVSVPGLIPWIATHSTNPHSVGIENTHIWYEILIPSMLAVLVQWGLIRRRWLRAAGQDDVPLWPWITTAVAALASLNPVGLALIWTVHKPGGGDLLLGLFGLLVTAGAAVLVVMAAVECYIRWRVRRRRLAGPQLSLRDISHA